MTAPPRFRLCLILTRALCRLPPLRVMEEAVRGGADLVQLREKALPQAEFAAWTRDALAAVRALGVPLIVNDAVEVALAAGAEGVHLGQQDESPASARRRLGPDALIGWSTRTLAQLDEAARQREAVDYVGFGPAFPTATKGYAEGLGPEGVQRAARHAAALGVPLLAIGGITAENRAELAGVPGVAVSAALCGAEDPREVAARLLSSASGAPVRTLGGC